MLSFLHDFHPAFRFFIFSQNNCRKLSPAIRDVFKKLCKFTELQKLHIQYMNVDMPTWFVPRLQDLIVERRESLREIDLQNAVDGMKSFYFFINHHDFWKKNAQNFFKTIN